MSPRIPPATELTYRQYQGWACVLCGASLAGGGRSVGRARGDLGGVHRLDVEVYACSPRCPRKRTTTKGAR